MKTVASARAPHLGWFLVFAVVYADIGTSIFYVPAILWLSIGNLATLAQIITTVIFVSIALKYVEICERCPDGGGVVSICRQAFSKWTFLPLLGGSFITVDYFLTSTISGVAGIYYLTSVIPGAKEFVLPATSVLFILLIGLNIVGLKESATVIAWLASGKILVSFVLLGSAAVWLTSGGHWGLLFDNIFHPGVELTAQALMIGYATTWLAYSGLESASQVSGAMKAPISKTAMKSMLLVILMISILSPSITATALYIVPDEVKQADPESLLAALAFATGGPIMGWAMVISATCLLFMACNTAIVGNYHVNVRLADLGYVPVILRKRHEKFGTPWVSVVVSGIVPILILFATQGSITMLGDLYAFGLLGTLALSSISIDKLRWQDGRRDLKFWWGVFTTIALLVAWGINIVHKPYALLFGGIIAGIMVVTGLKHRVKFEEIAEVAFETAEHLAADLPEAEAILTVEEACDAMAMEKSDVLISLRSLNPRLLDLATAHLKGTNQKNVYVVYVDEVPGLFLPPGTKPTPDACKTLDDVTHYLAERGISGLPIWRVAEDAGAAIAEAAEDLGVTTVYVGSSHRGFFWKMVRGRILQRLAKHLPDKCNLVVVG